MYKKSKTESGVSIVEAAVSLPVFFLLLLAIFQFGLLMSAYQSMVDAAREGARYGAAPSASAGYSLPSAGAIAQQACRYLNASVMGGNQACTGYNGGTGKPPALKDCTDRTFNSKTAAEDIYVGLPPTTTPEAYNINGSALNQQLVVVGIRKTVPIRLLGLTLNLHTCASMRSENN